jgi:hypothetical protein
VITIFPHFSPLLPPVSPPTAVVPRVPLPPRFLIPMDPTVGEPLFKAQWANRQARGARDFPNSVLCLPYMLWNLANNIEKLADMSDTYRWCIDIVGVRYLVEISLLLALWLDFKEQFRWCIGIPERFSL